MAASTPRPPALTLITSASPAQPVSTSPTFHRPSQSPFRYVHVEETLDEKKRETQLTELPDLRSHSLPQTASMSPSSRLATPSPSPFHRAPAPLLVNAPSPPCSTYSRPRALRIYNLLKIWAPAISYAITSLGFLLAIAFWKTEVFQGLDALSQWLKTDQYLGYAILFSLIFITTFPPLPLYSTLIILSGYTYGPWTGAVISYFAALTGAVTVFLLSRKFLRSSISRLLSCTVSIKRVVRAIEKRPQLLFLIRLAPYPYNVMNCLLAASPILTFRTYTVCTALSLFKVIIHTTIGSSIRSFADYHTKNGDEGAVEEDQSLSEVFTVVGIVLCVGILIYLSYVARKAVSEELEGEEDSEERLAFLGANNGEMVESAMNRAGMQLTSAHTRSPVVYPSRFESAGREEADIGLD